MYALHCPLDHGDHVACTPGQTEEGLLYCGFCFEVFGMTMLLEEVEWEEVGH